MPQFRAKARAVDLLGKGQIADLPTAISELWKNGYDAYGDNLATCLYLPGYCGYKEPVFVLSDDGKGMDEDDIHNKWFVLGTDSKSRSEVMDEKGPETLYKTPRVKMGEKGIGRLAVAYLGPQMLMITKKANFPLEVVFFDWRILENYNLFLSDVTIPQKSILKADEFGGVFNTLKSEFLLNFPEIGKNEKDPWKDQPLLKSQIVSDCQKLMLPDFITSEVIADLLTNPAHSHATRFVIFKPDEQIIELKDFSKNNEVKDKREDDSGKYTITTLAGLFNIFRKNIDPPKTALFIAENGKEKFDILDFAGFFIPEDFDSADHLIDGEFDEFGTFNGSVRIYRQTVPHTFTPLKPRGAKTSYGPFKIKLGYLAGRDSESILNEEQRRYYENKLDLFAGLYVYRDGFRVLPYGRADNDFLEFEERRGRSAGEAFFAKRRMFGCIDITRAQNKKLIDKSSREGFITNAAYRDFRADVIEFFIDLSKKYFSTKAEYDYKRQQQEDLKEQAEAEKQEHERDKVARKEFAGKLNQLPKQLSEIQKDYDDCLKELELKSEQSEIVFDEIEGLVNKLHEHKVRLDNLKISKPTRFKPTPLQNKKFQDYTKSYKAAVRYVDESSDLLNKVRDKLKVNELFKEFQNSSVFYKNTLSRQFSDYNNQLDNIFKNISAEFDSEKASFISDFDEKYQSIIPSRADASEISRSMKLLERIFSDSRERITNRLTPYFAHLERLSFDVNEDNLVGYYKDQFQDMKDEWNKTYELAQLGIAVEIIDHQFNTLYSQLAESIKSMRSYLVPGEQPLNKYHNLSNAFDHLQDNYKLLQPLYRTTGRIRKDITGEELKTYADDFFRSRFDESRIDFTISDQAKNWTAYSYESIFKPVVINIINNAIFWLQAVENKVLRLDAIDGKLLIMNSGQPIDDFLLEDVFKLFFSNRPKGRGIGLYLAKQSLNGIGYEIEATNDARYNLLNGACFLIYPSNSLPNN